MAGKILSSKSKVSQTWQPTSFGIFIARETLWSIKLGGRKFVLTRDSKRYELDVLFVGAVRVRPGFFWAEIEIQTVDGHQAVLKGIPNANAAAFLSDFNEVKEHFERVSAAEEFEKSYVGAITSVENWVFDCLRLAKSRLETKGWLSYEFRANLIAKCPAGLDALLDVKKIEEVFSFLRPHLDIGNRAQEIAKTRNAEAVLLRLWKNKFVDNLQAFNAQQLKDQKKNLRDFFDTVEKSPLSAEQIDAVVNFENRVMLVAAAGSGKTSTMVAKACYALKQGYVPAERIVMLAFNKAAAKEMRARVTSRLEKLNISTENLNVSTFHAFGLQIIGDARKRKPSIPKWLDKDDNGVEKLNNLILGLKDGDKSFRTLWDMFRVVLYQDLPKFGDEELEPDSWNKRSKRHGFWTLSGETVKSKGEKLIADWLFYNGIEFEYERDYEHDTADANHRQYQPDFYFPKTGTYLEHWAFDEKGNAPVEFVGYKEAAEWKRNLHKEHQTDLLETTMAELWSGQAFQYLRQELTRRGIELDPNPDREVPGRKPIEDARLVGVFRTFLAHYKSNCLSFEKLEEKLQTGMAGRFAYRHKIFLSLFRQVHRLWQDALRLENNSVDFEDMLAEAVACVESGDWESPYELVMVDEFQDSSYVRSRLIDALVRQPNTCLFAVGDDWQSINRFAGSDLSVMTDFNVKYPNAYKLMLATTFRCPQTLCDISSEFVQRNPRQIRKVVRSRATDVAEPLAILSVKTEEQIKSAVESRILEIAAASKGSKDKVRILVLVRYNDDRKYVPELAKSLNVELAVLSVHTSKGLEGDYVIVPRLTSETFGFPSKIEDDPMLTLVMPGADSFQHAEERRLFYVALTRAKKAVTLISVQGKESSFLIELVKQTGIAVHNQSGGELSRTYCPKCDSGYLVTRRNSNNNNEFMACSAFPRCSFTKKIRTSLSQAQAGRG
ncbi:Helicase IV [compost metagenome]